MTEKPSYAAKKIGENRQNWLLAMLNNAIALPKSSTYKAIFQVVTMN